MSQSRLFARFDKQTADRAFQALDLALEDIGAPIAITEIDEDADIHELSLYAEDADIDLLQSRAGDALREAGLAAELNREALPDIDWVAQSLEGLKPVRAGRFLVHGSHDRDKRQLGD
ncbi:50S ribosomal protein L11 methyltransferase, partial [Salmonella enterica subsp. enterica serovar Typhi]|nr:50S ribosomal protein L11 methyltransferase [Salmonella enterica subsp. enterica serovar Typhi]